MALPWLKKALGECKHTLGWYSPALALLAVGLRHQHLRTEVANAVGPARQPLSAREDREAQAWPPVLQSSLRGEVNDLDAPPDAQELKLRMITATALACIDPKPALGTAPDEHALEPFLADPWLLTHLANWPFDFLRMPQALSTMPLITLVLANQPPR